MRDAEFARLVDELDRDIARSADEEQAQALVDRFAVAVADIQPSTTTALVALASLVRGLLPTDRPLKVTITAFARIVVSLEVVRRPDGSPVYHDEFPRGEAPGVLQ